MPSSRGDGGFAPIAIVGRGCVLPGALTPDALWSAVRKERDLLGPAPVGAWRLSPDRAAPPGAGPILDRGGYIRGFEEVFEPGGFHLPVEEVLGLDPSTAWLLHAGQAALREAGHDPRGGGRRIGAVVGNLSLPSVGLSRFAESVWLGAGGGLLDGRRPEPAHRFMSGLPVHRLARALDLRAGVCALDAACASSLYALRLACDALHDGRADLMLAGALNGTDPLFLHTGFRTLQALSPTGRSRPFHRGADGLVPSLGAVLFALKRLEDAVSAGDRILGVIRAVGLSNDGGSAGLLVPAVEGQERAIRAAYAASGLHPRQVSLIECHATGTPVGDAAEIRSTGAVFAGLSEVPIGSLKSNLGHALTVSGAAGLLKVLSAMEAGVRPATLHLDEELPEIAGSPFRLLRRAEPWAAEAVRRAAVSSFGFGGNNAHLLVEEWSPESAGGRSFAAGSLPGAAPPCDVAIVGIGVIAAGAGSREEFAEALLGLSPRCGEDGSDGADAAGAGTPAAATAGLAGAAHLEMRGLRFPPNDLLEALPQQLFLLQAAHEAIAGAGELRGETTGVYVGMQCDAEVARHMARLRLSEWAPERANAGAVVLPEGWLAGAQDAFAPPLTSAAVLGTLPNVVANRVSAQFRFGGPGLAVSAEELSGIAALELAARAVRAGEIDAAVVGAVDLCCEAVHRAAAAAMLPEERQLPGDAAVVLVLKRLADAERDGSRILAVLPGAAEPHPEALRLGDGDGALDLTPLFGHAHAASGLLHVAAAAVCCATRAVPARSGPAPWLTDGEARAAAVTIRALGGESATVLLREGTRAHPLPAAADADPTLDVYAAEDRDALIAALRADRSSGSGPARVAIAAWSAAEREERRRLALAYLSGESDRLPEGVAFRESPVDGELALVFTGAGAAYHGMGRELVAGLPDLLPGVARTIPRLHTAAAWAYGPTEAEPTPLQRLTGSSFLSQLHALASRELLGLAPSAALGLSSGETNSLVALGAWDDFGGLLQGLEEIYTRELGGEFRALRGLWGEGDHRWEAWRVLRPAEIVREAIGEEPRVFLVMRHAPGDCAIAGEPAACRRVLERLGTQHGYPLGYDLAVHGPPVRQVEERWRELHRRPTRPVPGVRFYSAGAAGPYEPTADAAAEALTEMAAGAVDFVALVERAWADGVRVFVEHGPRDLCARWIGQILGERDHLAVSLDRPGTPGPRQLLNVAAELSAAGVAVDAARLLEHLRVGMRSGTPASTGPLLTVPAHPAPVRLPEMPSGTPQGMDPAPPLPRVLDAWDPPVQRVPPPSATDGPGPRPSAPDDLPIIEISRVRAGAGAKPIGAPAVPRTGGPAAPPPARPPALAGADGSLAAWNAGRMAVLSHAHREFLARQSGAHRRFLELQGSTLARLSGSAAHAPAAAPAPVPALPLPPAVVAPAVAAPAVVAPAGAAPATPAPSAPTPARFDPASPTAPTAAAPALAVRAPAEPTRAATLRRRARPPTLTLPRARCSTARSSSVSRRGGSRSCSDRSSSRRTGIPARSACRCRRCSSPTAWFASTPSRRPWGRGRSSPRPTSRPTRGTCTTGACRRGSRSRPGRPTCCSAPGSAPTC